jgi:hypothetical protein
MILGHFKNDDRTPQKNLNMNPKKKTTARKIKIIVGTTG